jgi:hypothetical protein
VRFTRLVFTEPEINIGEKRTGPALNPLKGSSARLPHVLRTKQPAGQN